MRIIYKNKNFQVPFEELSLAADLDLFLAAERQTKGSGTQVEILSTRKNISQKSISETNFAIRTFNFFYFDS